MPNLIEFRLDLRDRDLLEVTPVVDGSPLTSLVTAFEEAKGYSDPAGGYGGLIPAFHRYGPAEAYYLGRAATGPFCGCIYVLGCECGEVGCWPLWANVTVTDDEVTWSGFNQPYRKMRDYSDFGPFVFRRTDYERAIRQVASGGWDAA